MTKGEKASLDALEQVSIVSSHGRPARQRSNKKNPFNAKRRQRFLDALALCCNVRMSAEHAGVTARTLYNWRGHDPVFKAQWRDALEIGLERLEMLVVEHGGAGLPLDTADPDRAVDEGFASPAFDFDKAIRALQLHAKARSRPDWRSDRLTRQATAAETDAAIVGFLRRLGKYRAQRVAPTALPAPDNKAAPDKEAPEDPADGA